MFELAVKINEDLLCVGDTVVYVFKGETRENVDEISEIYRSVHVPYEIRIGLRSKPYNKSFEYDDFVRIKGKRCRRHV